MSEWIADWLSYRPSDFLMFAPGTYWRLFELHNEAWWPLQLPAGLGALVAWAWLWRGRAPGAAAQLRGGLLVLAAAAVFVAWAFVWRRYVPINWSAGALALTWALLALALLVLAACGPQAGLASATVRRGAAWLLLCAATLWPACTLLEGRAWRSVEVVGLAPDPTLVATLAWLLATRPGVDGRACSRASWRAAWLIALACAAFSAATLATMGSLQWLPMVAAAACACWLERRARRAHIPA